MRDTFVAARKFSFEMNPLTKVRSLALLSSCSCSVLHEDFEKLAWLHGHYKLYDKSRALM